MVRSRDLVEVRQVGWVVAMQEVAMEGEVKGGWGPLMQVGAMEEGRLGEVNRGWGSATRVEEEVLGVVRLEVQVGEGRAVWGAEMREVEEKEGLVGAAVETRGVVEVVRQVAVRVEGICMS